MLIDVDTCTFEDVETGFHSGDGIVFLAACQAHLTHIEGTDLFDLWPTFLKKKNIYKVPRKQVMMQNRRSHPVYWLRCMSNNKTMFPGMPDALLVTGFHA